MGSCARLAVGVASRGDIFLFCLRGLVFSCMERESVMIAKSSFGTGIKKMGDVWDRQNSIDMIRYDTM